MKSRLSVSFLISFLLIIFSSTCFAGGSSSTCDTRYPVVLVHGMGSTITEGVGFWERIVDSLEEEGAEVYVTAVNRVDSTADKAADFKGDILAILAVSRASKVNIIAHSHGTLYSRYAISNLGLGSKIASHTSLCGPHRGSSIADVALGIIPDATESLLGDALDMVFTWLGDDDPDILRNGYDLTTGYMKNSFNPNTPNVPGLYYQSWAARIKGITSDFLYAGPLCLLLKYYEGPNDCLVSITSAKWGNFRGTEDGAWWCGGVSHFNMVDKPNGNTPGFSSPDFFVDVVSELKDFGY